MGVTITTLAMATITALQQLVDTFKKSCVVSVDNQSSLGLIDSSKYGEATLVQGQDLPAVPPVFEYQEWDGQHWKDKEVRCGAGVALTNVPQRFWGTFQVEACMVWKFVPPSRWGLPQEDVELYLIVAVRNIPKGNNKGYVNFSTTKVNAKDEWKRLDKSGKFKDSGSVGDFDQTHHFKDGSGISVSCKMSDDPKHCEFDLVIGSEGMPSRSEADIGE